jgi:hypothetical protein
MPTSREKWFLTPFTAWMPLFYGMDAAGKWPTFAVLSVHSGTGFGLGCGVDDLLGVPQRKRDISVDDSLKLDEYSIYNVYHRTMAVGKFGAVL